MEEKELWNREKQRIPSDIAFVVRHKDETSRTYLVKGKNFILLTGALLLCIMILVGMTGFYGWHYHHRAIDKAAYEEYLAHKAEQDAKLQALLDDNEKMLRDMSEIHTLETKLRRSVIQNGGNRDFTSTIDEVGAEKEVRSSDPGYSGKGGTGTGISMVEVVAAQNKNLAAQIDGQKKKMNELLSILEGRHSRKSILPDLWPTEGGSVSSPYGIRVNPIHGGGEWHTGVDIAADFGAPVYAAAMGTVEAANWNGGYGQYIKLAHGNGYESVYAHLSGIAVVSGQTVRKGEIIGFVGSTGYSTGPHLHFEIFVDGENIDPLYMLKR